MRKFFIITVFLILCTNIYAQWNLIYTSGDDIKSVFFIDQNTGWAAGNSNSIIKTTNGGNSWFTQDCGLLFTTNFNSVFFYDNQNGFIVGDPHLGASVILRTINGGTNWQLQSVPVLNYILTCVNFVNDAGSGHIGLVCGYNSTTNMGIILKTTNDGINWIQKYNDYGKLYTLQMIDFNRSFVGGDIFLRSQDCNNWNVLPSASGINDLYFVTFANGWMCTETGKIFVTKNNGNSWEEQLNLHNNEIFKSIFFTTDSIGWVSTAIGNIFKTTDAGVSWTKQITEISTSLDNIVMTSDQVGFAAGADGKILKTINGGGIFTTLTQTFKRNNVNKPILPNELTLDTIKVTSYPLNRYSSIVDVDITIDTVLNVIDSNLVFIITHAGTLDTIIYKAGKTGNNFIGTILDDDANIPIENGHAPFDGYYRPSKPLSQLNNLSISGDWIISIYHEGNNVTFDPLFTGVIKSWGIAVTYHISTPQITGIEKIPGSTPNKFTLYQNYPNPFNPETVIRYSLKENSNVVLKVYNIVGKEVAALVNKKQNTGTYEVKFSSQDNSFNNLPSGIYFYRLSTNNYAETKKMMLIK